MEIVHGLDVHFVLIAARSILSAPVDPDVTEPTRIGAFIPFHSLIGIDKVRVAYALLPAPSEPLPIPAALTA